MIDQAPKPLIDPAWKSLRKKAREAREHQQRLRFGSERPLRIKRFIEEGELDPGCKDLADLYDSICNNLNHACSHDICGTVLFEGEDGRLYGAWVEGVVGLANPEHAQDVMEIYVEPPDDYVDGAWLEWEASPTRIQEDSE